MMAAILNSAILDSATLVFPLKLTHTCKDWFLPVHKKNFTPISLPAICTIKLHSFILTQLDDGSHLEFYHVGLKNFTHSFWLNLMMAAILNSAILDSDTLFSSLRFTQKHSHSTLTLTKPFNLTQTHSFWLNLTMAAILNSTILDSAILVFPLKLTHTCQDWVPTFAQKKLHSHFPPHPLHKKPSLIHSDSTWWWQPSLILPSCIQTPCFVLSDSLKNTLTPLWLWLKLIQSDSNLFILTQLDDGSHLWILPTWIWPSWIQPS